MPYGVLAHLPVVHLPSYSIAIMQSADHVPIGLILISCGQCPPDKPNRRLYHCGLSRAQRFIPLNVITSHAPSPPNDFVPRWEDVRLAAWPAFRANDMPTPLPRDLARTNLDPGVPFRVSSVALRTLQHAQEVLLHQTGPIPQSGRWARAKTPMTLVFRARYQMCFVCVDMGLCESEEGAREPWARVRLYGSSTPVEQLIEESAGVHTCSEVHISRWEAGAKTFSGEGITTPLLEAYFLSVDLLFAPSVLDSTGGILELQHIGFTQKYQD